MLQALAACVPALPASVLCSRHLCDTWLQIPGRFHRPLRRGRRRRRAAAAVRSPGAARDVQFAVTFGRYVAAKAVFEAEAAEAQAAREAAAQEQREADAAKELKEKEEREVAEAAARLQLELDEAAQAQRSFEQVWIVAGLGKSLYWDVTFVWAGACGGS